MKKKAILIVILILSYTLGINCYASDSQMLLEAEKNSIDIFEKTVESVVNVSNIQKYTARVGFDQFETVEVPAGTGSGYVWDQSGHIVTNFHVIQDGKKFFIAFHKDQKQYEASIVGFDPANDVAVLKLKDRPKSLKPITPGVSQALLVGQKAIAIGNPFGLSHTMTQGIVSALGREMEGIGGVKIHNMIQTDASINPGNSGGPLLSSQGKVIGMNTQIISGSGSSAGLGFAIPIDTIKNVVDEIIKYGKVRRPQLGIKILNYQTEKGLIVGYVEPEGPAAKAGIRGVQRDNFGRRFMGDIIVAIEKFEINTYDDIFQALSNYKQGDLVKIKIIRNEKEITINVTLGKNE